MVGAVWLLLFASVFHQFAVNGFPESHERVLLHRLHRSTEDDRDVENYQSDREVPRDVPTRPDYTGKGHWAKGSLPDGKDVDVGFVPQKIYTQVRKYDTVKHLPRSAAADEASTHEEKVNAPRLREVLSQKKIQQVYEEEGYEDLGYDHGGYNHHGSNYEDKEKNEDLTLKKPKRDSAPGSAEQVTVVAGQPSNSTTNSGSTPVAVRWKRFHTETQTKKMSFGDDSDEDRTKSVVEEIDDVTKPFVKEREPVTVKSDVNGTASGGNYDSSAAASVAEDTVVAKDGDEGDSGSVEARDGDLNIDEFVTAESHRSHSAIREEPSGRSMESRVINDPRPKGSSVVTFPGRHTRRQYAPGRPLDVFVQESVGFGVRRPVYSLPATPVYSLPATPVTTNVHHYLPYMPAFPSYYSDNPAAFTAQVISQRLPVKQEVVSEPTTTTSPATTAPVTDTGPVKFLNAADTLNAYANLLQQAATTSSTKPAPEPEQNYADLIQPRFNSSFDVDISATTLSEQHNNATTMRRRPSKFRHPIYSGRGRLYNNFTRTGISHSTESVPNSKSTLELKNPSQHTRHPSLPRDSSEDASHDTPYAAAQSYSVLHGSPYIMQRPQDPVKYIESLTVAHFANGANVPKSPPSVQNERLRELARQLNARSENVSNRKRLGMSRNRRSTDEIGYDHEKYPFYDSYKGISRDSALKYASNPDDVPKSPGGLEFYETRDKLVKCDEPQAPDDVVPERDEDGEWNEEPQPENPSRMKSLGDSIDCMKLKYFGREPLDNPFFKEETIGDPPMYGLDGAIKDHVGARERKIRSTDEIDRVMIIPSRQNDSSPIYNHNYTNSDHIRGEERANGHSSFPYPNHKSESAEVSPSVHNLRVTSPYKYYSEHDDSYFPVYNPQNAPHDSDTEDSKRHKYYHHNYKHKYIHTKKKRVRPPSHGYFPRPFPVSIYSVIAASKSYPMIRRPMVYSSGSHVIPVYHADGGQVSDNYISDSKNSYQAAPTKWYIVRPGEYTENKDLATDSKTSGSSIWNYINPLRWWFPAYFDERRGEPKYRRKRSTIQQQEQELFNRILARTNNATLQAKIFDIYKTSPSDTMKNHQETTTGRPISISEFKARMNATSERLVKTQSKLNRLTGGFMSRNSLSSTTPSYTNTISSPSYGEDSYGMVMPSTTPMSSSSGESNPTDATTAKPKVLFPRTRKPSRRKPQPTKMNVNTVSRSSLTTTTSSTTTTTTPSTTTRMYKPKRVLKKKFDKHISVEAFPVLRRSSKPTPTTSPFDSVESSAAESGSVEEPRRLQQVEHRRVTKEEVYKTSYIPEEERRINRNMEDSVENYSMSSSESSPVTGPTMDSDNHTLTYMVNPVTGVGSWGEQPRRTTWRPKRKYPKRHLDEKTRYRSTYTYPPVRYSADAMQLESRTNRNRKRHSGAPHYDSQAYITGLMNQVYPKSEFSSRVRGNRKSPPLASSSFEDSSLNSGGSSEDGSDENYPPPTKSTPKFILDPGKRKYFYVRTR